MVLRCCFEFSASEEATSKAICILLMSTSRFTTTDKNHDFILTFFQSIRK